MRRILYTALLFLLIPAALCADFGYKLELCWGRDEKANQGREIRATNLPL